jgi:hypothetical protein
LAYARLIDGWIYEKNVRPFFEAAVYVVAYRFDNADWDAVAHGLSTTDGEADRWFDYPLEGDKTVIVGVARDPGSSVVLVRASGHDATLQAPDPIVMLMQSYVLSNA